MRSQYYSGSGWRIMINRKMELINLLAIVVGVLCLLPFSFMFSFSLLAGFLLGGIIGLINYRLIVLSISAPLINGINRRLRFFKLIRFALIGGAFALAIFFPSYLNVYLVLVGFMLNKLMIIFYELVLNKRKVVKEWVNT